MNKSIAVGIITYNPGDSVVQRLVDTIQKGYKVYIFDNTPEVPIIRNFLNRDAYTASMVSYHTCGKNVGLGYGLSAICAQAYYDSFATLLFFDQDTVFRLETLDYISEYYQKNRNLCDSYSSVNFNSKKYGSSDPQDKEVKNIKLSMNSGSLFFLENVKKIGWHNTKYFVDCVDYEFSLSSRNARFKLGEHTITPGFDHCTEQGDQNVWMFGREYPVRAYPFSRIRDSVSAYFKLLAKSIVTRNGSCFLDIGSAFGKYIFIQTYVRILNAARFFRKTKPVR